MRIRLILCIIGILFVGSVERRNDNVGSLVSAEAAPHIDNAPKNTITHVTLTCYQPVKEQCDDTPTITADGSKINLSELKQGKIKWCAISRDLLWLFPKDKPKRVLIEGYGIYEVRDLMNKRFDHRIDILIHPTDKKRIREDKVKVTILG